MKVACKVVGAAAPVYDKLVMSDPVTHPIETHVDGFGSALFDGVI